jgi:hypothetical protein
MRSAIRVAVTSRHSIGAAVLIIYLLDQTATATSSTWHKADVSISPICDDFNDADRRANNRAFAFHF